MGGIGSGRYIRIGSRARRPVADKHFLRLDVRELHKSGLLCGEARGSVIWQRGGVDTASIGTRFLPCELALRLEYEFGPRQVPVRETVKLTFTACHFGGDRPWFRCPHCDCRCAVLWGRGRFLCRTCQRLSYPSQNESIGSKAIRRIHEIRAALHAKPCLPIERIGRPRYMRYDRFRTLIFELLRHEASWTTCIIGLSQAQPDQLETGRLRREQERELDGLTLA
jgi:hypothetical protein